MKTSIVIAVLDSHKAVERQLRYFEAMPLPDDMELILVDDGSDPPLKDFLNSDHRPTNLRILRHDIDAIWTQPAARNYGAKEASGEFLILTDIDHILCKPLIDAVSSGKWDCMMFEREVAVLDEDGCFVQDDETVLEYGYLDWRLKENKYKIPRHVNSFGIRKSLFWELGAMNEHRVGTGKYPNGEDGRLRNRLGQRRREGTIQYCPEEQWPMIYMFPNGKYTGDVDHNPFDLFHDLTRKVDRNRQWRMQKAGKFKRE